MASDGFRVTESPLELGGKILDAELRQLGDRLVETLRVFVESGHITIVDEGTTPGAVYICRALPGTVESAEAWQIERILDVGGGIIQTGFANGSAEYNQRADQRASHSYS